MKSFVNPPFEMGAEAKAVALPRVLENKNLACYNDIGFADHIKTQEVSKWIIKV
ncbi:MAG: hypothetical protein ACLR7D_02355 [Lachnospira eligens]